jgi:hypothetical protein
MSAAMTENETIAKRPTARIGCTRNYIPPK